MKISYNWLKEYVSDLPEAEKLRDVFTYHICEVESVEKIQDTRYNIQDTIFDLNILPNRAHDLLCHRGVAFELAGLLGLELRIKNYDLKIKPDLTDLKTEVKSDKCPRYMGRIVRKVEVISSPAWLKERLEAIGQRSINNLVDLTNYILNSFGQPVHVFDLDKVQGDIIVRPAKEGEKIMTLDKKEVILGSNDLVIADQKEVLAIAGVKGGQKAEVDGETKNIIIEVANFDPVSIRKTAHRIKIHTDAVKRFENNLSPELCDEVMTAITALILEINSKAEIEEVVDYYPKKQEIKKINFLADFVNKKLGTNISANEMEKVLKNYKFEYVRTGDSFRIIVPTLRLDLENENDLVEEIGRVIGYDMIEPKIPKIDFVPKVNEIFYKILWARRKLLEEGYYEVMTYTFRDQGKIEVLESASDKKFLRENLTGGLKESYQLNKLNAPLLGQDETKIFEIGTVFSRPQINADQNADQGGWEEIHVAYADKKGIIEKTLDDFCQNIETKNSYDDLLKIKDSGSRIFDPWSNFPFISRDIAVWVPKEIESHPPSHKATEGHSQVYKVIKENAGELLVNEPRLVDEYHKDDRISYAYRLVFQSMNQTLTDQEVNKIMDKIYHEISKKEGWQIR